MRKGVRLCERVREEGGEKERVSERERTARNAG